MRIIKKIYFTVLIIFCLLINVIIINGITYFVNIHNNYCIVSFNSNGGTIIQSQLIKRGTTIELPEEPTKLGFYFIGWIYNGEIINKPIFIEKNTTLVAKWETYNNLSYDINDTESSLNKE